jgi:CheY-like chemotaxis protein
VRLNSTARRDLFYKKISVMPKQVLDVGQCAPDHAAIRRLLERNFDANVVRTHELTDTLEALRKQSFDLVLINRKLDIDYSDGMTILEAIKDDPQLAKTPVMIVTNYSEHQQAAVAAGGEYGFGKNALNSPETLDRLQRILG